MNIFGHFSSRCNGTNHQTGSHGCITRQQILLPRCFDFGGQQPHFHVHQNLHPVRSVILRAPDEQIPMLKTLNQPWLFLVLPVEIIVNRPFSSFSIPLFLPTTSSNCPFYLWIPAVFVTICVRSLEMRTGCFQNVGSKARVFRDFYLPEVFGRISICVTFYRTLTQWVPTQSEPVSPITKYVFIFGSNSFRVCSQLSSIITWFCCARKSMAK